MDLKDKISPVRNPTVKEFLTRAQSSHMIPHYTKEGKKLKTSKTTSKPIQHSINLQQETKADAISETQSNTLSSSVLVHDVTPVKLFYEAILGDDGQFYLRQARPS